MTPCKWHLISILLLGVYLSGCQLFYSSTVNNFSCMIRCQCLDNVSTICINHLLYVCIKEYVCIEEAKGMAVCVCCMISIAHQKGEYLCL